MSPLLGRSKLSGFALFENVIEMVLLHWHSFYQAVLGTGLTAM